MSSKLNYYTNIIQYTVYIDINNSIGTPKLDTLQHPYLTTTTTTTPTTPSTKDISDMTNEEYILHRQTIFQNNAVHGIHSYVQPLQPYKYIDSQLNNPEFTDYVNYTVWNNYTIKDGFDYDDLIWDDDIYTLQTLKTIQQITDLYLNDHQKYINNQNNNKNITRILNNLLLNTNITKEQISKYLKPDENRGINYTNEIIEMKGKMILKPLQLDPEIEYKDDIFTPNEELRPLNMIGTIRNQYNWLPNTTTTTTNTTTNTNTTTSTDTYIIEENKVQQLQPLLKFVNFAAELISTKVTIVLILLYITCIYIIYIYIFNLYYDKYFYISIYF